MASFYGDSFGARFIPLISITNPAPPPSTTTATTAATTTTTTTATTPMTATSPQKLSMITTII